MLSFFLQKQQQMLWRPRTHSTEKLARKNTGKINDEIIFFLVLAWSVIRKWNNGTASTFIIFSKDTTKTSFYKKNTLMFLVKIGVAVGIVCRHLKYVTCKKWNDVTVLKRCCEKPFYPTIGASSKTTDFIHFGTKSIDLEVRVIKKEPR